MKSLMSPLIGMLQIILLTPFVNANILLPDQCSPTKIVCVGEGQSCMFDQINGASECRNDQMSICRVCRDFDLTCHAGICIRNIGEENDDCQARRNDDSDGSSSVMTAEHLMCRDGLSCVEGKCSLDSAQDIRDKEDQIPRGRGEQCDPDLEDDPCMGNLACDLSRKCAWPVCRQTNEEICRYLIEETCIAEGCVWDGPEKDFIVDDANRFYRCRGQSDCHFGKYCDTAVSMCLPAIPIGQRLNAACLGGSGTLGSDQCGLGMSCSVQNPLESNPIFKHHVCMWESPFSNGNIARYNHREGERCQSDSDCGKNMLCSGSVCSGADTTHDGEGCSSDNECGRGMICICPLSGDGGRKRCSKSWNYMGQNIQMEGQLVYQKWINCVTTHKCLLVNGWCSKKHCERQHDQYMALNNPPRMNVCSLPSLDPTSKYTGLVMGSSHPQTSVSLVSGITAIISLYLSFWVQV